jgi:hypothetical protein
VRSFFTTCFFLIGLACHSQVNLSIAQYQLPGDNDTIYKSNLNLCYDNIELGPKTGSIIPYFKLFGINNDSLDIFFELKKGKPVFLISASYTCPKFRQEMHFFDSLAKVYKNQVSFFIIYTIEAHPYYPDFCPWLKIPKVVPENMADSIIYRQPVNYGARKKIAKDMIGKEKIKIPVFLDNPSNQWLNTFGPMVNMAYFIDTKGKIIWKCLKYTHNEEAIVKNLKEFTARKKRS